MNDIQKITAFLEANGWTSHQKDVDYLTFSKPDSVDIDVGDDEIVFIDDTGDFAHIVLDFYALVGFIYIHRLILPVIPDFKEVSDD